MRFRAGDGDSASDIVGVNAFDPSGQVISSQIAYLATEGATILIGPRGIGSAGIAKLAVFGLRPAEASGVNLDDFSL